MSPYLMRRWKISISDGSCCHGRLNIVMFSFPKYATINKLLNSFELQGSTSRKDVLLMVEQISADDGC